MAVLKYKDKNGQWKIIASGGSNVTVDLSGYATKQELNNKVDKVSGKQLSTEDFTTALKTKLEGLSNYNDTEINAGISALQVQLNTLVSGNVNDAINSFNEIIAFLYGVKDSEDLSSIIASIEQQIASKMDKITLANVATSGSYNDLKDKPTIPSTVTEGTVSGWGFTKNTGTYSKPSTGIPSTDLSSDVQSALTKANSALQSETYKGTVTGVKVNGTTKNPSNGVVDLGAVITAHQDISGKQNKVLVENHGTNVTSLSITPNVYHKWGTMSTLSITLATPPDANAYNEYMFEFVSGSSGATLTVQASVKWVVEPDIEANKTYQVSIVNNVGVIVGV